MSANSLSYVHPIVFIGVLLLFLGKGEWPARWVSTGWVVFPAVINPFVWAVGSHAFGWVFGGLGAWIAFFFILPANGLVFGACGASCLHRLFGGLKTGFREFVAGLVGQLVLVILGLALASQFEFYIRDLQP